MGVGSNEGTKDTLIVYIAVATGKMKFPLIVMNKIVECYDEGWGDNEFSLARLSLRSLLDM